MFYIFQSSGLVVYLIEHANKSGDRPQASLSHERFTKSKECADFDVFFVGTAVYASREREITFRGLDGISRFLNTRF
jgi:hypothetical protein